MSNIDPVTGQQLPDTGYFMAGNFVVITYLKTRVTSDITVESEVPNPRPARLIVVKGATTSSEDNLALGWRRNIIHTYETTESLAVRMSEIVRGWLVDGMYTRGTGFRGLRFIGEPIYFPEPDDPAKTPRGQLTVDVRLRKRFDSYGSG